MLYLSRWLEISLKYWANYFKTKSHVLDIMLTKRTKFCFFFRFSQAALTTRRRNAETWGFSSQCAALEVWSGLRKDHVWALNTRFCSHKQCRKFFPGVVQTYWAFAFRRKSSSAHNTKLTYLWFAEMCSCQHFIMVDCKRLFILGLVRRQ